MGGWLKIHKKILDWEWYRDVNTFKLFLHLLLKANVKDNRYMGQVVSRGSLITNRATLMCETGLTEQEVRTALKKMTSSGEITIKSTNKFTVINIANYGNYQDNLDNKQLVNNQQSTNNQPTDNQQSTSLVIDLKKGVERKNKKMIAPAEVKKIFGEFENVLLTESEYGKLVERLGDSLANDYIERISAYIASTKKKYSSHYATLLNWHRKDSENLSGDKVTGQEVNKKSEPKKNRFNNFEGRDWDFDEIARLEEKKNAEILGR